MLQEAYPEMQIGADPTGKEKVQKMGNVRTSGIRKTLSLCDVFNEGGWN